MSSHEANQQKQLMYNKPWNGSTTEKSLYIQRYECHKQHTSQVMICLLRAISNSTSALIRKQRHVITNSLELSGRLVVVIYAQPGSNFPLILSAHNNFLITGHCFQSLDKTQSQLILCQQGVTVTLSLLSASIVPPWIAQTHRTLLLLDKTSWMGVAPIEFFHSDSSDIHDWKFV